MTEEYAQVDEIVTSLRRINQAFHQLLSKDADKFGITSTQLIVLRKLARNPDIGITELAELLHLGNSGASGVVDRMVKAGLITRSRCESDRRVFKLAMTEKGQAVWEKSRASLREQLHPLEHIPAGDAAELIRIHGQIVKILEQGREQEEL